uniref:Related to nuclear pore protein n=1 Tax=Neurospora crassa TaxID=5141 RepID=Q6M9E8_NEUCS|nr:related to nuclear pore protein [Neurospora crassa]
MSGPSTSSNASAAVGFAAARGPGTAQFPPSLFGASGPFLSTASTGGSLFGPSPVSSTVAPAAASATRGSLFGTGASAAVTLPTNGGLSGSRPVSTTATPIGTGSGLFGSAPVQRDLGAATAMTSSFASGTGLFGSAPATGAPTSTGSSLFGSGAFRAVTTPATGGGLFGSAPAAAGHTSTGSGLFGSMAHPEWIASTTAGGPSGTISTAGACLFSNPASDAPNATGTNKPGGSTLPHGNVINIDPEGDLLLDVGGDEDSGLSQPQRLRVCSFALRRHSPVWKQMLFGPWKESKPANAESEVWIVELPDDPFRPMQIVLDIIHGRFSKIPRSLGLDELYKLVILTNKYDMTETLRPWCADWAHIARGDLSSADTLKSLFIAWELGDEDLFALRIEEISVNTSLEAESLFKPMEIRFNKTSVLAGTSEWINLEAQDYLGPQDVHNVIRSVRSEVLSMIVAAVKDDMALRRFPSCRTALQPFVTQQS